MMPDLEKLAQAFIATWQPIATAPKDGTGILAFQNGNMRVCSWSSFGWAFYQFKPGEAIVVMVCPTHWMPLPPAPVDAVLDASGRLIAPPQPTTPARPSGPWDGNGKVEP